MTYTLELVKDDGSFDKHGASNITTVEMVDYPDSFEPMRIDQLAGKMLQDNNIYEGEGWVNIWQDGFLVGKVFS